MEYMIKGFVLNDRRFIRDEYMDAILKVEEITKLRVIKKLKEAMYVKRFNYKK